MIREEAAAPGREHESTDSRIGESSRLRAQPTSRESRRLTSRRPERELCAAGFVLMELALAIFVLAVGILGMVILLNDSMSRGKRAAADTRQALFAQSVFQGLHAVSFSAQQGGRWTNFWYDFADGYTNLAVAAPALWSTNVSVNAYGLHTNVFVPRSGSPRSHVLRYRMEVDPEAGPNRVSVLLRIWEGEFGRTDTDGKTFYSEFYARPRL